MGFVLLFIVCIKNDVSCDQGTSWAMVDSPSPDIGATHVAVGVNVVWALTKDNKVRRYYDELHRNHIVVFGSCV